jgi:PAS domain S-box-containing protein
VWSFRDVTESKRTEEELRESEQRFRQVFKQGPLGIAIVDLALRITNVNGALCDFVGRTREELLDRTFASLTYQDDAGKEAELTRQTSGGTIPSCQTEMRFVRADGEVVFGNVTASVIRGEFGAPIYGLRIIEDITKRKRLERELVAHAMTASKLLAGLTPRETEILDLLSTTETASQIAERLSVSVRTVESHLANAYRKLGVRSRDDAVAEFRRLTRAVAGRQVDFGGAALTTER